MSETPLEQRIQTLEQQMQDVLKRISVSSPTSSSSQNWRKSLGMFDDHPVMKQIDVAGERIRRQDREPGAA
ncbi:MAG: hypothetical protein JNM43_25940 [Planctomycetaceae bacterium]|nr:hypothetical protein [Planctomycetaceae bacterium]